MAIAATAGGAASTISAQASLACASFNVTLNRDVVVAIATDGPSVSTVEDKLAKPVISSVVPQTGGGGKTAEYQIVAKTTGGQHTEHSDSVATTDSANDLTAPSSGNDINWTNLAGAGGGYDIYRISFNGTTPATLGKIAHVGAGVTTYRDAGAAGDGSTAPTTNTTGNTFTLLQAQAGTGVRVELWKGHVDVAKNSNVITVTPGSSCNMAIAAEEYSGVSAFSAAGDAQTGNTILAVAEPETIGGNDWIAAAIGFVCNSGDTFNATIGTIRRSSVPAATAIAVALVDNSCTPTAAALPGLARLSTAREWAAAGWSLESGDAAISCLFSDLAPYDYIHLLEETVDTPTGTTSIPVLWSTTLKLDALQDILMPDFVRTGTGLPGLGNGQIFPPAVSVQ